MLCVFVCLNCVCVFRCDVCFDGAKLGLIVCVFVFVCVVVMWLCALTVI